MATLAAPPRSAHRHEAALSVEGLILFTLAIRIAAHFALDQPMEKASFAAFLIARALAEGHVATLAGMHGSPSLGYPLFLAPILALLGATKAVAIGINLILSAVTAVLVWGVARQCGMDVLTRKIALLGHALWLSGIWNCTLVTPENLLTPLLLGVVWLSLRLMREGPRVRLALATGLTLGAAVLTAPAAMALLAVPLMALAMAPGRRVLPLVAALMALMAGAAATLAPWLTTAPGLALLGGSAPALPGMVAPASILTGSMAGLLRAHAAAAPYARDLSLLWTGSLPGPTDFAGPRGVAAARLSEIGQFILFLWLGWVALTRGSMAPRRRLLLATAVLGFWTLDLAIGTGTGQSAPTMPLLILAGAGVIADWIKRQQARPRVRTWLDEDEA